MKTFYVLLFCILLLVQVRQVNADVWPSTVCCLLFCDICCLNPFCIGRRKRSLESHSVFGGLIKHKTCENTKCRIGETCFDECDNENGCRPICKTFFGP